jgi:hypothetical protein
MSYKAYLFRLRTKQDVDDLDKYINHSNMDGIAFFDFFYIPKKKYAPVKFAKTDLVAAITVDRGDLAESLQNEAGLQPGHYFERLERLGFALSAGNKIHKWEIPEYAHGQGRWIYDWPTWAKKYLKEVMK